MAARFKWNEENEALVSRMISEGASVASISHTTGISPNAIFKRKKLRRWRPAVPKRRAWGGSWEAAATEVRPAFDLEAYLAPYRPLFERDGGVSITELGLIGAPSARCRWPYGEAEAVAHRFCGEATGGPSYCREHRRLAYRPALPGERKALSALKRVAASKEETLEILV